MKTKRYVFNKMALSLMLLCLLLPVYSFAQVAEQEIIISRNIEYTIAVSHKKRTQSLFLDIYQLPKLNQIKRPVKTLKLSARQFRSATFQKMSILYFQKEFMKLVMNKHSWTWKV
jgi:hypothetical protein